MPGVGHLLSDTCALHGPEEFLAHTRTSDGRTRRCDRWPLCRLVVRRTRARDRHAEQADRCRCAHIGRWLVTREEVHGIAGVLTRAYVEHRSECASARADRRPRGGGGGRAFSRRHHQCVGEAGGKRGRKRQASREPISDHDNLLSFSTWSSPYRRLAAQCHWLLGPGQVSAGSKSASMGCSTYMIRLGSPAAGEEGGWRRMTMESQSTPEGSSIVVGRAWSRALLMLPQTELQVSR